MTLEASFTFRNLEPTEALKDHTLDKLEKLDKYLVRPATAHIILSLDGHMHHSEITLRMKGDEFVAHDKTSDMYASIDSTVDKLKVQIKKEREKRKEHK